MLHCSDSAHAWCNRVLCMPSVTRTLRDSSRHEDGLLHISLHCLLKVTGIVGDLDRLNMSVSSNQKPHKLYEQIKVGRPKNALVLQLLEGKATLPACTCSCCDWFHLLGGYPQHEHPSAEWHVFTDPAVVCLILHCKKSMISFDLEPGWTWNLAT